MALSGFVILRYYPKITQGASFYKESSFSIPKPEVEPKPQIEREKEEKDKAEPTAEAEENKEEKLLPRIERIAYVVSDYFAPIKSGLEKRKGLIFKSEKGEEGRYRVYLLTFYPLEWPFAKVELPSIGEVPVSRAYLCSGGVIAVEVELGAPYPIELDKGSLDDYGAIVYSEKSEIQASLFKEGECKQNGFVFDLSAGFAGICFGGKFINYDRLYSEVPDSCKTIYEREAENGDI